MHSPVAATAPAKTSRGVLKALALAFVFLFAATFVAMYVFRYYLNYNEAAFADPIRGAANYWHDRGWLLLHITAGMLALLSGPWQFSSRIRRRYIKVHRFTGYVFLTGVALGSMAAIRLAIGTTFGWAFGFSLFCLALAWLTTAGMAFYAIKQRQVQIHQEWMVRAYVVTFGFVIFRVFNDFGPTSRLQPVGERADVIAWACWVIPLMVAEVVMQLRRMRRLSRAA